MNNKKEAPEDQITGLRNVAKMSKRKTGKDDSTPHENEELSERQSNGKRDKKKQKKARREEMEASAQTEKKTHKRKRVDEEDEEDTSGYNDRGPKDSIKQGAVSKKDSKKKKKKSKKAKKAPSSEDDAEKMSEAKAKKEEKKKASKKEKKKSKKEKKAKKSKATTEEKEKASNGDSAKKEKEVEAGASSATSNSSNGGSDQGGAGWNNWEASSFGDDARKNKFLRLMGAKKTEDNPSQPPQKKGLFGSLRASSAPEPSAIDSSTEQKITHDLTSQFQDALQRRNCRGGIGLDSGTKKSDRSAEPQPHPYAGGKASTKLHIDDYPKSIKFDD
ncbi:uncharacterized protein ACA1_057300 [Acanthamoeba castellanii str. Neff]|uniref:Small acidic protein n=1 Tax=Acanthamoeba castellanii (strain ATCC 30010 / Neff) TaxID=1257118 RepID=L8GYE9_ACACF|nr:uncharacterized protein ACA1_057300 [Acanthamoeba castellanii str. Neff]ELR17096.1 hypothetical protein ACA1_057300 [Acanthamoeba castellanii str. Neff]